MVSSLDCITILGTTTGRVKDQTRPPASDVESLTPPRVEIPEINVGVGVALLDRLSSLMDVSPYKLEEETLEDAFGDWIFRLDGFLGPEVAHITPPTLPHQLTWSTVVLDNAVLCLDE